MHSNQGLRPLRGEGLGYLSEQSKEAEVLSMDDENLQCVIKEGNK